MKDPLYWAMSRRHLSSVLDILLQQGSQTQTTLGAKLSEAITKAIGDNRNLELENAYRVERQSIFSCFFCFT